MQWSALFWSGDSLETEMETQVIGSYFHAWITLSLFLYLSKNTCSSKPNYV